ncbi:gas vesicle protein GvpG [Streptomyces radicis]|uniref:Gas vesicle protein n=1 Tax=Streptomyces radicis TaxID=1750517 RepID=A0A3A9WTB8_9ACTN|nr:gas vesicle protein GvpG [Streptomyces radicis]RKN09367.1 gas vesicle protein [Streptomyces radicis]RKN23035.1 gas vesicle protein [Streptomyces radicis]
MGLISGLLLLPLAPARGVGWVANRVADAADREYRSPGPLMARLAALHRDLECGAIDQEEFERQEEIVLTRLERLRAGDQGEQRGH